MVTPEKSALDPQTQNNFHMDSKNTPIVQAQNLGKHVPTAEGNLVILEDINLAISPGETAAIVGVSGSGKSTLLGLLAGLDTPSSGKVWLAGVDIQSLNEDGRAQLRAQQVGFVFQSFQLLASLTAWENVMLPLELTGHPDPKQVALRILQQVEQGSRIHHYPAQLSGGEQQRVAIARAFATNPAVLFADEPTGNLDQRTGQRIIELLFRLNHEQGTTLVLVTHDQTLANQCDRQLTLEGGKLVDSSDQPKPLLAGNDRPWPLIAGS